MNEAIKLAIEKGGYYDQGAYHCLYCNGKMECEGITTTDYTLLDPLFWQALKKALGWPDETINHATILNDDSTAQQLEIKQISWLWYWHRYIDWVAAGKDPELFWKEILK